tara:strand:- start:532 stop:1365 length:834 start_codon:yes stop_codon:yes gene_type:complete
MSLFRFFSGDDNSLDSFEKDYIWFSDLKDFNDVFEGCFDSYVFYEKPEEVSDSMVESMAKDFLQNKIETIVPCFNGMPEGEFAELKEAIMKRQKERHEGRYSAYHSQKWACFSIVDREFGSPVGRELMWGHYGKSLKGFAVEYHRAKLIESLDQSSATPITEGIVHYLERSRIGFYNEFLLRYRSEEGFLNKFLCQKSKAWSYETELRLGGTPFCDGGNKIGYKEDTVRSVFIGSEMSEESKGRLLGKVNRMQSNVDVFEVFVDDENFLLKTKQIRV